MIPKTPKETVEIKIVSSTPPKEPRILKELGWTVDTLIAEEDNYIVYLSKTYPEMNIWGTGFEVEQESNPEIFASKNIKQINFK